MVFPFLDGVTLNSVDGIHDDLPRVHNSYQILEQFELNYSWDPNKDSKITPPIRAEWNFLNQKVGKHYVSNAKRVLSIGGGGETPTLDYLSKEAEFLCVLNPSRRDLEMYRRNSLLDSRVLLIRGLGELVPFKDSSFDLVEIPATLDHCLDPEKVISECFRVLQQQGKIVITGGNSTSWYRKIASKSRIPFKDEHGHHHTIHLDPEMLSQLLISRGFRDIQCSTNYFLKLPKYLEHRIDSVHALGIHQLISNKVLPKLFGEKNGGMLLVGATKAN